MSGERESLDHCAISVPGGLPALQPLMISFKIPNTDNKKDD